MPTLEAGTDERHRATGGADRKRNQMGMSFKDATDRLREQGIRLREIAAALGIEYQRVRAMRAEPGSAAARTPPPPAVWGPVLMRLAGERARSLQSVAATLELDLIAAAQGELVQPPSPRAGRGMVRRPGMPGDRSLARR